HEGVFTDLEKLSVGDEVYIDLNNKQYRYIVKEKKIIKKGADVPTNASIVNNNVLTLVSCWPPGKNYQRIAVITELQN
ncbi:MAG: sortase, partial [Candidatus Staskawiczbacteria bacterium]|nr:sortase [Candidatus Staskawiczbacteria bacterium]